MKFILEIELGNEAMRNADNVRFALDSVDVTNYNDDDLFPTGKHVIRDHNGNTVGKWEVIAD